MERYKRSERLVAMIKILTDEPGKLFSLNYFTDYFNVAKSTVSEDIAILKQVMVRFNMGLIRTLPGAAGGVKYLPLKSPDDTARFIERVCSKLSQPERILPGGYIYMTDLIFMPDFAKETGEIFATHFADKEPEYVITVETKGIPLALMTARALSIQMVIIRRNPRVTEGSSVSINYVSGSSGRIQSMTLTRRALPQGAKVLLVDDFMRGGGTIKGMSDLMHEFQAKVVGIGVLATTAEPKLKLINDYFALANVLKVDPEERNVVVTPGFEI